MSATLLAARVTTGGLLCENVAQSKLAKKLKRELTANPKKAAMLGLLCVMALWFWAPLLGKWFGGKKPLDAAAPVTPASSSLSTEKTVAGAKPKTASWRQVSEWIEKERNQEIEKPGEEARDPFAPTLPKPVPETAPETPVVAAPPPEVTPQRAGLRLHSTIVGVKTKAAFIDNRTYREGQTITATNGRDKFKLISISPRGVTLENAAGKQYEVKLPSVEYVSVEE